MMRDLNTLRHKELAHKELAHTKLTPVAAKRCSFLAPSYHVFALWICCLARLLFILV